uniref:barstar family protein n=1 Tax=Altererythrobacter segetis TaxID=1104773 RepID=UPI003C2F6457
MGRRRDRPGADARRAGAGAGRVLGGADTGAGEVWGVPDVTTNVILDGRFIRSEADFHDLIEGSARAAGFEGYGRNLDALWDVVTAILPQPVEVHWLNENACRAALGDRFDRIVSVFRDAEDKLGSSFRFEMEAWPRIGPSRGGLWTLACPCSGSTLPSG